MQIAIPTVLAAILAGFIAVELSGRSWLWVGVAVGSVVGWTVAKWKHFYLNRRGPMRSIKQALWTKSPENWSKQKHAATNSAPPIRRSEQ
jgi:hypothetical protein